MTRTCRESLATQHWRKSFCTLSSTRTRWPSSLWSSQCTCHVLSIAQSHSKLCCTHVAAFGFDNTRDPAGWTVFFSKQSGGDWRSSSMVHSLKLYGHLISTSPDPQHVQTVVPSGPTAGPKESTNLTTHRSVTTAPTSCNGWQIRQGQHAKGRDTTCQPFKPIRLAPLSLC